MEGTPLTQMRKVCLNCMYMYAQTYMYCRLFFLINSWLYASLWCFQAPVLLRDPPVLCLPPSYFHFLDQIPAILFLGLPTRPIFAMVPFHFLVSYTSFASPKKVSVCADVHLASLVKPSTGHANPSDFPFYILILLSSLIRACGRLHYFFFPLY